MGSHSHETDCINVTQMAELGGKIRLFGFIISAEHHGATDQLARVMNQVQGESEKSRKVFRMNQGQG